MSAASRFTTWVRAVGGIVEANDGPLPDGLPPLPSPHRDLLRTTGGCSWAAGHERLLGGAAALRWNDPATWKHAWSGRAASWWCFAMTSVGDQLAYAVDDLLGPDPEQAAVHRLDAFDLEPKLEAATFHDWLAMVMRPGHGDDDDLLIGAMERFGELEDGTLLAVSPPVQLGLDRILHRLQPLPAATVMIFNGDARAEAARTFGSLIDGIDTYTDEAGRYRLRFRELELPTE